MRKYSLVVLLLLAISSNSFAQLTLTGTVKDTAQKRSLINAVIAAVNKKDSTLAGFSRSDAEGKFALTLPAGNYSLLITYPKFADYTDDVALTADKSLGNIALTPKSLLLKEVIIRTAAAVRIKGDTTEFTADSFVVKEGATVEDLLKKLPGFQVNAKGEITAQGKKVEKVLVDGEEFFGDDPTMATQNLSAKIVDKVQVFDNKTEQQNLTGISNGNEGKTINIKLKEDKKKGGFGKITAASDFDRLIDTKALYNRFVGKKKFSVYGTKSDLNTGSLNWEDRQKLGVENDFEYDEISGYYFSYGDNDEFNDWSLRGLPHSYTAGTLFSNKWNTDKQNLNLSYRFNRLETDNESSQLSQINLQNSTDYRNKFSTTNGISQQHAVNGKYEWKLDSLTSLKLTVTGLRKTNDQTSETETEYLTGNKLVNNSDQDKESHTVKQQIDNVLTYRQAFKKKNRLLIATLRFGITDDDNYSTLRTIQNFYRMPTLADSTSVLDQYKTFNGNSKTTGGKITFSEPLSTKWSLILDYGHNENKSYSHRNTYNKATNGKYENFDPAFSNNFDLNAISNSGSTIFKYTDKKLRMSLGSGLSGVTLNSSNLDLKKDTSYHFLNMTPQAQFGYTIKPQTNVSFNYRGTTRQPTINQLQPVKDNSDPLNEFVGNQALKVGFNHSFGLFFNQYKTLKQRGIWLNANYSITENAIVNSVVIDPSSKKQTYMPVNAKGMQNWFFWGDWNKSNGPKKLGYSLQLQANGGRNISFLNLIRNTINYSTFEFSAGLNFDSPDKWSFEARPKIGYNSSSYSNENAVDNDYLSYGGYLNGFVMLPGKIEVRSDWNFDLRQRTAAFTRNSNIIQWNGSIGRKIFKKNAGTISLVANDLLNQNKGFDRSINGITVTEDRYSRLSRYFLLKFEWSFTKMPGTK
ncbi:MAG: hypothetical protein JWP88_791 [Flaviaesturariibacter sp.]|nr:hypothetical protein [Flaviaesturariibacter sp.]